MNDSHSSAYIPKFYLSSYVFYIIYIVYDVYTGYSVAGNVCEYAGNGWWQVRDGWEALQFPGWRHFR